MRLLLLMSTLVAGIAFAPTSYVRADDDDERWERAEAREGYRAREVQRQQAIREWNRVNRDAAREWENRRREFVKEQNKRIRAQFRDDERFLREQYERYGILPYEYQYPAVPYRSGRYDGQPRYGERFYRGGAFRNEYELIPPPPPAVPYEAVPSGWYRPNVYPYGRAYGPMQ
jgi:hypothetical protein